LILQAHKAGDKVKEMIFQTTSQNNISFQGGCDVSGTSSLLGIFYMNQNPLFATRYPILHFKSSGNITTDTLIIDSNTLSTKSINIYWNIKFNFSTTTYGYLSGLTSAIYNHNLGQLIAQ
jgi:hypothetical protein